MEIEIELPPELEAMVRAKAESGHYADESEVIREALQLMEHQDGRDRFGAAISIGRNDLKRGDSTAWSTETSALLRHQAEEEQRLGVPLAADAVG